MENKGSKLKADIKTKYITKFTYWTSCQKQTHTWFDIIKYSKNGMFNADEEAWSRTKKPIEIK